MIDAWNPFHLGIVNKKFIERLDLRLVFKLIPSNHFVTEIELLHVLGDNHGSRLRLRMVWLKNRRRNTIVVIYDHNNADEKFPPVKCKLATLGVKKFVPMPDPFCQEPRTTNSKHNTTRQTCQKGKARHPQKRKDLRGAHVPESQYTSHYFMKW